MCYKQLRNSLNRCKGIPQTLPIMMTEARILHPPRIPLLFVPCFVVWCEKEKDPFIYFGRRRKG